MRRVHMFCLFAPGLWTPGTDFSGGKNLENNKAAGWGAWAARLNSRRAVSRIRGVRGSDVPMIRFSLVSGGKNGKRVNLRPEIFIRLTG